MKTIWKVISIIIDVVLCVILVSNVYVMLAKMIGGVQHPQIFGYINKATLLKEEVDATL